MKNLIRLREMELFLAVCRTGSVTNAAHACGLSQPAASTMLKELEERLGIQLFSRQRRRLELTASARSLLPDITHALSAFDAVNIKANSMGQGSRQHLIIGTVSATGASVIPQAVSKLRDVDKSQNLIIKVGTASEVIEMAIQQRIDFGLVLGAAVHEHVGFQKIADLRLVAVVRPDHQWARRKSVSVSELVNVPYIAHSRHLPVGAQTSHAVESAGFEWNPGIEVAQFSAACGLTEAGCGPSVLDSVTGAYARKMGLMSIPLETKETLSLNFVWPLSRGVSPAARVVMDEIVLQEQAWRLKQPGQRKRSGL